jgi:spermidine synthase
METKNTDIKNVESKIYNNTEKKDLVKKIEKLTSKNHYKQIFKILKSSGIKITQNSNGVFFNMNDLNNDILKKIDDFLDLVLNQEKSTIDVKYYNNVILNTTTASEMDHKTIIDYNNDSTNND